MRLPPSSMKSACAGVPICRYSGQPFPRREVTGRYTSLEHYIDGNWLRGQDPGGHEPRHQQVHRRVASCLAGRPRPGAGRRRQGYKAWRKVSAYGGKILHKAADLVPARADEIAKVLTQE